eukprot:CAMPEP_0180037986 /NCGR_PEP_ID=MMETSP0984-20121128/31888_1 /TAXON_ID=483367 /ORGANISM="non described non described, Strain CCMP 2436" /LENGTH=49 /DNA_ID= /DNA_START= /DNA_END= /DNA_ORIENTATION=
MGASLEAASASPQALSTRTSRGRFATMPRAARARLKRNISSSSAPMTIA